MDMMGRKRVHRKKRSKSGVWLKWAVISLGLTILASVVLVPKLNPKTSLPCANSISCIKDLTGKYQEGEQGVFLGRSVASPTYIADSGVKPSVLGTTAEKKRIFVDLTTQTLGVYEGDRLVYTFPVSTGKWYDTPTGDYRIWVKLRYTRMEGGSGSTYYNLPNVPYTMFFHNNEVSKSRGFAIHGAYWHNNFGHPMSHGCINMRPEDAEVLFAWAQPATDGHTTYESKDDPGTLVTVYGEPPE